MKTRILATALLLFALVIYGREQKEKSAVEFKKWTLDEAMTQLRLYPNDSYLQYVAMILARNENKTDEVATAIETTMMMNRESRWQEGRREQVDLFSIFTGALAVQESLQLDTMRGDRRPGRQLRPFEKGSPTKGGPAPQPQASRPQRETDQVPVASLTGPTVKSHPWEQMLAGKKSEISGLAKSVPDDFYFVNFHSVAKMLEAMEISDLWGTHLFNQAVGDARTQKVGERLKVQLALETTPLLRPFYDLVVSEAAVTGSDLFLREGSDVTLLFRFKQPEVFRARMDSFLTNAEKAHPSMEKESGKYLGVAYVHLGTPDRELNVYSAYPAPDLHVRSNSLIALRRVLEAVQGKTAEGQPVRRLGDTAEFAYIRTLLPQGAKEEDGLVYLSDPFIRKLVGPQLKLTERRRVLCYNHLRMIGHAALLFRTEHDRRPESLADLVKTGCCPGPFNDGSLRCPDGGTYSLSHDGSTGICSLHAHAHFLTPCCEIPVTQVTKLEADEYRNFLQEYNQYWRTFFDPIALRLQITPERYRLETIVLPLIDNSIYTSLAMALGGRPENLESLPIPKKNIFTVAFRFDKEKLLRESGLQAAAAEIAAIEQKDPKATTSDAASQCTTKLKVIGLAMHNYHDTYGQFPPAAILDNQKKPLLSWRVQLLPFFDHDDLYKEFHLDEPWDSEHNKKLIAKIPEEFQSPSRELTKAGKTTYLAPIGKRTLFPDDYSKVTFASVQDGTSNTFLIVDAADDHAVVWTKPDDLKYDPDKPAAGLRGHHKDHILVLMADGSAHAFRDTIPKESLQKLFDRADGQIIPAEDLVEDSQDLRRTPGVLPWPLPQLGLEHVNKFLTKGMGNQLALHVYDSVPMFDFNLPGAVGMTLGMAPRGGGLGIGASEFSISFLIASLNAPVYVSVPLQDEKIVDDFLDHLDTWAVNQARHPERNFIPLDFDFYKFPLKADKTTMARSFGLRFGPAKFRFMWARIGKGLYIASKPFILEDLMQFEKSVNAASRPEMTLPADQPVHALIHVRPKNWNQVLADFRLGWAENNREACLRNLGPLSSVARAIAGPANKIEAEKRGELAPQIHLQADQLHTTHFFCPDGGQYQLASDGKSMMCTIHGSAASPRQPQELQGALGNLLASFSDMTATLTFREDGLHATVTIERK
jgi:hypothetical protein